MFRRLANKLRKNKKNKNDANNNDQESGEKLSNVDLKIDRKTFNYTKFVENYPVNSYDETGTGILPMLSEYYRKNLKPDSTCLKSTVYKRVPALRWLQSYNLKEFLLADIISGITVATVHVPQSMGYALLATVSPVYGLYTSFYPVLIYWIFGTILLDC
jgi:hypothetical protein